MEILIGMGVAAMFAAVGVMFWMYIVEKDKRIGAEADNAALRNDLHAAINARKAKSRGITGKYRRAIAAHQERCTELDAAGELDAIETHDLALWSVLDSEAV